MTAFTSGPWSVRSNDECSKVQDSKGHLLAMCSFIHSRGRRDTEEVRANAHLIAAAPEMYAALNDIHDFLRSHDYDTRLVRSAIAKAKGEAQ